MTKIEYSDRHRFMASMGLALIALAGIIPWLYLKEPFDLLVEQSKLDQLTALAREIISFRQAFIYYFSFSLPIIALLLLILGITFLSIGLARWQKKQDTEDQIQKLGLEALKRQSEQMSQTEINEKYLDPTISEPKTQNKKAVRTTDAAMPTRILNSKSDAETKVSKAKEIEEKILAKIEPVVSGEYEVMRQRKISGRTFDAIFAGKTSKTWDRLVEIKYFSTQPSKDIYYRLHDRNVATAITYKNATGRSARGITIVVVPNEEIKKATRDLWFKPMTETFRRRIEPGVSVISEGEIDDEDTDIAEIVWEPSQFEL